jgi:hypothetical protein
VCRWPVICMHAIPLAFFARPAEQVGPDLVGCRLVKHQAMISNPGRPFLQ